MESWEVQEVKTSVGRCFKLGTKTMLEDNKGYICLYDDHGWGINDRFRLAYFIRDAINEKLQEKKGVA